jgi:propanol-preferring alcohol dehydrogenase
LKTLARKGRFVLVSQPETVSIPFRDLIFKDITVVGSLQGNPKTLKEVVELAAKKGIVVKTRLWKLDEVNDLWTNQASPDLLGKNVVVW